MNSCLCNPKNLSGSGEGLSPGPPVNPGKAASRESTALQVVSKIPGDLPGCPGTMGVCTEPLSGRGQSMSAEDMTSE